GRVPLLPPRSSVSPKGAGRTALKARNDSSLASPALLVRREAERRHRHRPRAKAAPSSLSGDENAVVRAGDCVVIPPGVPHKLRAGEQETLVVLCCCVQAYSHADTVLLED